MTTAPSIKADSSTGAEAPPAVLVRGLSHVYKPTRARRSSRKHALPVRDAALDGVDLQVNTGEVFALLGPNGSGKSTLLKILATVLGAKPDNGSSAGTAKIFGHDIAADAGRVRQQLGVVFQHPALDLRLTALENLRVHGRMYGLSGKPLDDAANQALQALGLSDRINNPTESFSGGMRRRVEIAKALLTRPKLMMMDEASAGLDLAIQRDIWADLKKRVKDTGLTVLLTTHLMDEAEQADRVAVMSRGKVVAVDTPGALVARVGGQVLVVTPASGKSAEALLADIRGQFADRIGLDSAAAQSGRVHIEHPEAAAMIEPLARALGERAAGFRLGRPTLADAYLKLTGQELSA